MQRKCELNLLVGINGSGKTTFITNDILKVRNKNLIITPDPAEWKNFPTIKTAQEIRTFTGTARIIHESIETLETITQNYSGGNLILDDCMEYLTENTPHVMRYIYIRRRQFGIDCYMVSHGLKQLPPKAFSYASWLILFHSVENFTGRKNELLPKTFERIIEAQTNIAQIVESGKDPYHKEIILLDKHIRGTYVAQNN